MTINQHFHQFLLSALLMGVLGLANAASNEATASTQTQAAGATDNSTGNTGTEEPAPVPAIDIRGKPHGLYDPHGKLDPERLIRVALQHEQEGRYAMALKTLDEGIGKFPKSAQLYGVRASLLLKRQNVSEALSDLEKAVELDPNDAKLRINRALAYRSFGRYDEALKDLDIAIEKTPDYLAAYFNRGALLYAREYYDKALKDFDQCIAIDPHSPAAYFNRGSTYWQLGKADEAIADIKHFIELEKNPDWKKSAEDLLKKWDAALTKAADKPSLDKPTDSDKS